MSVVDGRTLRRDASASGQAVSLRSVAVPTEHGGWSLTVEPAVLGLLVAWSWPGLALALAALVAFVSRTSVKLVLIDRWRGRWLPRSRLAAKVAGTELVVLVALIVYATSAATSSFWTPLLVAAPMVALELWFDMRSRSRRLVPELAGSIGIGSIAAAIALADGAAATLAWGLWIVIAARSVAAIPYVRVQILRIKARPLTLWHSDGAQLIAVGIAVLGWLGDLVPGATSIVIGMIACINLFALRSRPPRVAIVGIQQMLVGVVVVAATAVSVLGS